MGNVYKDEKTNKWYKETDFLGTIFEEEITDEETIRILEESERALDEAYTSDVFDDIEEEENDNYYDSLNYFNHQTNMDIEED